MVVISKAPINRFSAAHPDAAEELDKWYHLMLLADWHSFNELKQYIGSASYIGNDRYIFNIRGNHYRLLALIFFDVRTVFVRGIFTHREYDNLRNDLPTL